jgi:hypothetical protein
MHRDRASGGANGAPDCSGWDRRVEKSEERGYVLEETAAR